MASPPAYNFSVDAVAINRTKNVFAASNDGAAQITGNYDYSAPQQSLAAGATVNFSLVGKGLSGVFYAQVDTNPFSHVYSIGCIGAINSAAAVVSAGFANTVVVPGGTLTVTSTDTGISVTASGGVTSGPFNVLVSLNALGTNNP